MGWWTHCLAAIALVGWPALAGPADAQLRGRTELVVRLRVVPAAGVELELTPGVAGAYRIGSWQGILIRAPAETQVHVEIRRGRPNETVAAEVEWIEEENVRLSKGRGPDAAAAGTISLPRRRSRGGSSPAAAADYTVSIAF